MTPSPTFKKTNYGTFWLRTIRFGNFAAIHLLEDDWQAVLGAVAGGNYYFKEETGKQYRVWADEETGDVVFIPSYGPERRVNEMEMMEAFA